MTRRYCRCCNCGLAVTPSMVYLLMEDGEVRHYDCTDPVGDKHKKPEKAIPEFKAAKF